MMIGCIINYVIQLTLLLRPLLNLAYLLFILPDVPHEVVHTLFCESNCESSDLAASSNFAQIECIIV